MRSAYIGKDARLAVFLAERGGGDAVDPVEVPRRAPAPSTALRGVGLRDRQLAGIRRASTVKTRRRSGG